MQSPEGITQLLIDWGKGDQAALEKLMPLVYSELRRLPAIICGASAPNTHFNPRRLLMRPI